MLLLVALKFERQITSLMCRPMLELGKEKKIFDRKQKEQRREEYMYLQIQPWGHILLFEFQQEISNVEI